VQDASSTHALAVSGIHRVTCTAFPTEPRDSTGIYVLEIVRPL